MIKDVGHAGSESMSKFMATIILDFFVAFGVILGGCFLGGLGAFVAGQPPMAVMSNLAEKLKIWAVVAAIGGTVDTLSLIERNFFDGYHGEIMKQIIYIFSAFLGAYLGTLLVKWLITGGDMP
jgi:hypothetical protein